MCHALSHFTDAFRSEHHKIKDQIKGATSSSEREALKLSVAQNFLEEQNIEKFSSQLQAALRRTALDLLRLAALLKDPSFHEEKEWRLVLPVNGNREPSKNSIRFKSGMTTLIPYIEHPLALTADGVLPLVDVILGPGSDAHSVWATGSFLKSQGIQLKPRESRVPYRHSAL